MEERDFFPYVAKLLVPANGFGQRLDDIAYWHGERGLQQRLGRGYRIDNCDVACWCFAQAHDAHAFHKEFGGAVEVRHEVGDYKAIPPPIVSK